MKIPLTRPVVGAPEFQFVKKVLQSGWLTQGPVTTDFETSVARYLNVKHAIACSNCTTALFVLMKALEIGPGDEVITTSFTFIATANAIRHTGAEPVFVDINPATFNLDPVQAERAITSRTKAILAVHQIGIPADLDALKNIAQKKRILLLEDAACALGSSINGKMIGASGHGLAACFSFHPRKVITTGEGGMIVTENDLLAAKIRRIISHGASVDEVLRHRSGGSLDVVYPEIGYNFRMADILAAVGVAQMTRLPGLLATRIRQARRFEKAIGKIDGILLPDISPAIVRNYQSFAIRITPSFGKSRDAVLKYLQHNGIAARGSLTCCHREKPYKRHAPSLPNTNRVAREFLILPLFHTISSVEQDYVIHHLERSRTEA